MEGAFWPFAAARTALVSVLCEYRALYFDAPMYLVGSAAVRDSDVGDLDVVVVLEDDLYRVCYPVKDLWFRDCAKQSRELTLRVGYRVDFKVQCESDFWSVEGVRVRLC